MDEFKKVEIQYHDDNDFKILQSKMRSEQNNFQILSNKLSQFNATKASLTELKQYRNPSAQITEVCGMINTILNVKPVKKSIFSSRDQNIVYDHWGPFKTKTCSNIQEFVNKLAHFDFEKSAN